MVPEHKTDVPADTVQPASVLRSTAALWSGVALSLLTLVTWVAFDVYDDRTGIIKNEQDRILTQARVIETNLEHQTVSVARVLRTLATDPGHSRMNQRLHELCEAMPGIRTLFILDRAGRVVASSREEILQRDFSDRDYFSIHRKQQRAETLYVSPPFTSVTGKFVINLSVMIPGRDGIFDGVVGATLDPDYFAVLLKSVHFTSSGMWSSIVHGDGLMFLMIPETAGAKVTSVAVPGTFYTRHITSGKNENVFVGISGISGTRRIMAMKTFNPSGLHLSKPLIIAVSRDADAVLADWRRESIFKCLAILLLAGFISLGTAYLLRRKRFFDQQGLQLLEQQVAARLETLQAQQSQKYAALIQGILESTISAIFSLDTSFCYSSFNQSHAKFMKSHYDADIEPGCCLFDYMPTDTAAVARTNLERALSGETFTVETEFVSAAGQQTCFEISHNPIVTPDGSITGVAVFAFDTTERSQTEDALRLSENLLREAQIVAGLGTYSLDVATGRWNSSDILNGIFGLDEKYDRDTSEWESRIHPEDREMMLNYFSDEVLGKLMPFNREYRIIRAVDGRTVWVHGMGRLEINGQGHPVRMIGTIQDITIRKQAEEILSKSKEQYDNLVSRINVGIYLLRSTPEGSYSLDYVSPRMSELVNCSVESLLADSRSWFAQIHPEDRDGFITTNQEGITLRRPFDWTGRLLVEGAVRWLQVQSSPELLMDGDVLWHGVITDITERRQAEETLKKRDAEIEQFIYTVSHDLRSPLVTVKTFLGYLENDLDAGDRERISQDLQYIHGASDKMKVLLDELLELSRIDRQENPPVRVSFRELLSEVRGALAGDIDQHRIDIKLPDNDLELFGDRLRLCQIWQNLIENAIKYRKDDCIPSIELGFHHDTGGVTFYVKDNGIGIDPAYHTKIFGVFEKLHPQSSGVGLGLTMIKRIVEKYNGRIWVESEGTGSGSCFYFTLPKAVVQD